MIERVRVPSTPTLSGQSRVRGRPFKQGNPGRPPGSKNKITRVLEELVENEGEMLTRKMIEHAKAGNVRCLQYFVDRLLPQRRGRPLDLQLPKINDAHDVPVAMAAITTAVINGNLTAEEAASFFRLFESYANAFLVNDFAVRLQNVETELEMMNKFKR